VPLRRARLTASTAQSELAESLAVLRTELAIPETFPADALAEADAVGATPPRLDLRDVPFVTLDPAGALDLDQAFHLERSGSGWRVRYAIADVPGFVAPGGAVDAEARKRGQTLYAPDGTVPLHPPAVGEDKASLLPGRDRPAHVWSFDLDDAGAATSSRVERAWIRSRAQLDYVTTERALDAGDADSPAALLPGWAGLVSSRSACAAARASTCLMRRSCGMPQVHTTSGGGGRFRSRTGTRSCPSLPGWRPRR
jgi:exoribonuclease R